MGDLETVMLGDFKEKRGMLSSSGLKQQSTEKSNEGEREGRWALKVLAVALRQRKILPFTIRE